MLLPFLVVGLVMGVAAMTMIRHPTQDEANRNADDAAYMKRWQVRTSGERSRDHRGRRNQHSAVAAVRMIADHGKPVPRKLVNAAMREALESGDHETLGALQKAFVKPPVTESDPDDSDNDETGEHQATAAAGTQPAIIVGKNSPIQGVDNRDWGDFVAKLRTKETGYQDDRHVGAYYHNRKRLAEIGIDPASLSDESAQVSALEADFKDVVDRHKKLINDFSGDVVSINGQQTSVTRSGILGLIKCAGIDNAREWLTNDGDRMRYPNTTHCFLQTNGLF